MGSIEGMTLYSSGRDRDLWFAAGLRRFRVSEGCLESLHRRRQLAAGAPETGGQLFAEISRGEVSVVSATDVVAKKGRFFFLPNRKRENFEIQGQFESGLHFVGDWHTHPEDVPTPSSLDTAKIGDLFQKSAHELPWFLLVIVGRAPFPEGLYVGVIDEHGIEQARPLSD